jgi:hypothetical protein
VRNSIYSAAGSGVRMMTVEPQYDLQQFYRDEPDESWPAGRKGAGDLPREYTREPDVPVPSSRDPFSDTAYPTEKLEDPFADPPPPAAPEPSVAAQAEAEEPYHVFNKGQKWVLILIIGAAGLFSGLSSNIYFPALDQIATVRSGSLS